MTKELECYYSPTCLLIGTVFITDESIDLPSGVKKQVALNLENMDVMVRIGLDLEHVDIRSSTLLESMKNKFMQHACETMGIEKAAS